MDNAHVHLRRIYKGLAILMTVLTLAGLVASLRLRWEKQADFDVIGILFLLTNLAPITVVVLTVLCFCVAVGCWLKVLVTRN